METYDLLMLIVLVAATLFGALKGFVWQLAALGSLVASYFVAYSFREPFSQVIKAEPPWNQFLAMLLLYVGTSLVIWVLFRMVSRTIDQMKLKSFDRQVGAVFGFIKGSLYCILATMFAMSLLGPESRASIIHSRSGYSISWLLDRSDAVIPPEVHQVVGPYLERLEGQLDAGDTATADRAAEDGAGPDWPSMARDAADAASGWERDAETPLPQLPGGYAPEDVDSAELFQQARQQAERYLEAPRR